MQVESAIDRELNDWVIPSFSTTNEFDRIVAGVTFLGTMSRGDRYNAKGGCGISSVKLQYVDISVQP